MAGKRLTIEEVMKEVLRYANENPEALDIEDFTRELLEKNGYVMATDVDFLVNRFGIDRDTVFNINLRLMEWETTDVGTGGRFGIAYDPETGMYYDLLGEYNKYKKKYSGSVTPLTSEEYEEYVKRELEK